MLFNSFPFLFIFLPSLIVSCAGLRLNKVKPIAYQLTFLAFSWIFIGYWSLGALFLILASSFINYNLINFIQNSNARLKRNLTILTIAVNLGAIAYYKYIGFFIDIINSLGPFSIKEVSPLLPIGISFYTFQQIACVVDIYKNKTKLEGFVNYCLFVSFFPQLIAGPIVLFDELKSQLNQIGLKKILWEDTSWGITFFTFGLFSKVFIADSFIIYIKPIFAAAELGASLSPVDSLIAALSYTLQIYFDFSGYASMAVGLGLIWGIRLPWNFRSPYKSLSIVDFWRRWHITLSHFLRDYLYIPLGGNRKGTFRRYLNLMLTMLLGGLWHGAGWSFVVWGGLHGFYLIINHFYSNRVNFVLPKLLSWSLTMTSVIFAWIFFRSTSLEAAASLIRAILNFENYDFNHSHIAPFAKICLAGFVAVFFPSVSEMRKSNSHGLLLHIFSKPNLIWSLGLGIVLSLSLIGLLIGKETEFLYFQF